MFQKTIKIILTAFLISTAAPGMARALEMPKTGGDLAEMLGVNAQSYIVTDAQTGQVLIEKNSDSAHIPASLTKLVTALVVLDTNPKLSKTVTMSNVDQVAGGCNVGGACIKSKPGVSFTLDGLFHAMLMPSANNSASALARSTGLSPVAFAERMNKKAASLGALNTHFKEPTGMDPENSTTAADYAKIVAAAFSNSYLRQVASNNTYLLKSSNNAKYTQTIKNTDKLLGDADMQILGAKTGYLNESKYNFATLLTFRGGTELAVVVLGEDHLYSAFAETKTLASLAEAAQQIAFVNTFSGSVLDAKTP